MTMPRLTIEWTGEEEAFEYFVRLNANGKKYVAQAVNAAGAIVERGVKEQIRSGRPSGRWYKVPGAKRKRYQASAAGEAPAVATGRLFGSIRTRRGTTTNSSKLRSEVVAGVGYALPLEYGRDDGRIEPRPFVGPGVEETADRAMDVIREAVRQAVQNK